jgi:ABC-type multidrug transport system ATPase subunit
MNQRLEFDGIEKSFNDQAVLSSIHMTCDAGTITGLLGRNGSGKSTLMKIVFGTLAATCKSVRVNSKPLLGSYLSHKRIGYLPQQSFIPRHLKVRQALAYYSIEASVLLHLFPEYSLWLDEPVGTLSGGYLRMLEVFLILKSSHAFVMLDEPFSGLMPLHIEMLKKVMLEEKLNKGVIISDHLYRHILDISDKTYLLSNGKTYWIKSEQELFDRGYVPE